MRVFLVGGTGFVGVNLANRLRARGDEVAVMGESAARPPGLEPGVKVTVGDGRLPGPWQKALAGYEVVVNLAGAPVFTRWTEAAKQKMRESRILTTRHVVEALAPGAGTLLLSASAVGYYGPAGEEECDEDTPAGGDFLARLCQDWEAAARRAEERGARVVLMRFGVVLGLGGGILAQLAPLFHRGLGGPIGAGRQWFSWIHVGDLFSACLHVAGNRESRGPYNFCAPEPVRNRDLARGLGAALHRPALLAVPAFAVRLGLGEFGEVVLQGQRVLPRRLLAEGFHFSFPRLDAALSDLAPSL